MTVHDQLRAEMIHDLRSYRAKQRERRKRVPILERMNSMRTGLGLTPLPIDPAEARRPFQASSSTKGQ